MRRFPWTQVAWALAAWPFVYAVAALSHVPRWLAPWASLLASYGVVDLVWRGSNAAGSSGGRGLLAFLFPSGRDERPSLDVGFSRVDTLIVSGDLDLAARWFRDALLARPADWALQARAAEFFAGPGRQPQRAGRLFAQVAANPAAPSHARAHAGRRAADLARVQGEEVEREP